MAYVIVIVVLVVIALSFRDRRWRCPACNFSSYNEADAQRHAEEHARHKPVYK
jgi:hypothetical protein